MVLSLHSFAKFLKCQRGVAFLELALCLPILLIMVFGVVEVSRYILIIQKLEKTASTVADVSSQVNPLSYTTTAEFQTATDTLLQNLLAAVPKLLSPYNIDSSEYVIVTDVYGVPNASNPATNTPTVKWQYCGGGTMKEKSSIGHSVNGTADLSSLPGFTMVNGEEMIIAEVFYRFTPILNNSVVPTVIIYRNNIYSPRYGSLSAFISHCK